MGGILILIALSSATLWSDLSNGFVWAGLGVTLAFGMIGFLTTI